MSKYFIDTKFIEDGKTIDLVSIGIISEDNREFYYISDEFDPTKADQWVVDNILSKLTVAPYGLSMANKVKWYNFFHRTNHWVPPTLNTVYPYCSSKERQDAMRWISRDSIAQRLLCFIGDDASPEFWGAWSAYDWVILCQLYGKMINIPIHFPYYCNDIIQWCYQLGLTREVLPPSPDNEHNSLDDARWVKESYKVLDDYSKTVKNNFNESAYQAD